MIPKTTADSAFAVDATLRSAEAASNEAAVTSAGLLLAMLKAHAELGAPGQVGLSALRHAARAATLAVEAREEHLRAHGALNVDLKKLGIDELFSKSDSPPQRTSDWRFLTGAENRNTEPAA